MYGRRFLMTGETMKYVCKVCGYIYDPAVGDDTQDIQQGTSFDRLPDTWTCPECGVGKDEFEPVK